MFSHCPPPSVPEITGAPCVFQSCCEWHPTHPPSSNTYRPRSRRCGVVSNLREVRGRAFGPINGRHPMVRLITAIRRIAPAIAKYSRNFPSLFICVPRIGPSCNARIESVAHVDPGYRLFFLTFTFFFGLAVFFEGFAVFFGDSCFSALEGLEVLATGVFATSTFAAGGTGTTAGALFPFFLPATGAITA